MTYRERREAKAARLRGYAANSEAKAAAVFAAGEPMRHDWAFITQPGHIPERARLIAREDRAHESLAKARDMRSRADNIEAAADHAIYRDDPDAVDRLTEKLAALEAQRDRIKAYNASARKGTPDLSLLTDRLRSGLEIAERFQASYQERRKHQLPPYVLSNLSGTIATTRKRLEDQGR